MAACETCWRDANLRAATLGGSVSDHYRDLLKERRDNPCEENPREKGDDDGVEYADPRDHRRGLE